MDLSAETEALARYVNGLPRARIDLESSELELFEADLAKARAAVFAAWLERGTTGVLTAGPREPPLLPSDVEPAETVGRTTSCDGGIW